MLEATKFGVVDIATVKAMSGLAFLEAIRDGRLPMPAICEPLTFRLIHVAQGEADFEGTPQPSYFNPLGTVHGGWAATLLDSCLGCAVHSTVPAGSGYTTLEIKVNYVRAIQPDVGPMRACGRVVHAGRTTATAEGRLVDANGRLYVHGSTTCLIMPF